MPHLLGDIRHGQIVLARKVGEQEKLREGDVAPVQLVGEIQDARPLGEQNKVRQAVSVSLNGAS